MATANEEQRAAKAKRNVEASRARKAAGYRQVSVWLNPDDVQRVLSLGGTFTTTARRLLLDRLREVELDDE